jgi:phosphonate transport system substrate-binding protein
LAQISGRKVSQRFFDDHSDVLNALLNDEVDMAFLGPLPYLTLSKKDPSFVPIGQFLNSHGEFTYTCALVTYDCMTGDSDSQIPQKIALTQPYSTCGYLMTESLLTSLGLSLTTTPYEYIGPHDECALRVIRKEVDLAGMKTSIAKKYSSLGLQVLAESSPIPSFLLVANSRTVSAEMIHDIQKKLLALDPLHNVNDFEITKNWSELIRYGAVELHRDSFHEVEQVLSVISIPEVGR